LVAKLTALGKITNVQTEGLKYLKEHPDEVQELLDEVFVLSNEVKEVPSEGEGSSSEVKE
jgi:hypothetical protein